MSAPFTRTRAPARKTGCSCPRPPSRSQHLSATTMAIPTSHGLHETRRAHARLAAAASSAVEQGDCRRRLTTGGWPLGSGPTRSEAAASSSHQTAALDRSHAIARSRIAGLSARRSLSMSFGGALRDAVGV
eukprot:CAMPEP_0119398396 /NCGR_PEP_ID=MMETSP1334-20130426/140823_1 /TAXON_ID=127549 /ORGANISM="Calcidiscus leptoporus, Strain RCC1130" /LENGTH=130 /DNA_ID=CAMNT_0007422255 /DNA_START=34 /DNA_END=426 /DNA_ORIENTATION=+